MVVFLIGAGAFGAIGYAFARPVYDASTSFADELPNTIRDAEQGRGDIGRWLDDIGAQDWTRENLPKIRESLGSNSGVGQCGTGGRHGRRRRADDRSADVPHAVAGPAPSASVLALLPPRRAERVRRVGSDAARQ
jgi:hypothetical protein